MTFPLYHKNEKLQFKTKNMTVVIFIKELNVKIHVQAVEKWFEMKPVHSIWDQTKTI